MIAAIPSAVLIGVDGKQVSVEVHVSNGLPGFTVVGLPDAAVREARDRVRAALLSSGLPWPLRRVTVNLAPSAMRKGGSGLDLPIAVGVLVASGEVDPSAIEGMAFVGELGLDGSLRGVPGALVLAEALAPHRLVVRFESAREAQLAGAGEIRTSSTLRSLVDRLRAGRPWPPMVAVRTEAVMAGPPRESTGGRDLSEVRGQRLARLALEIAAAGGHHMLLVGPPGSGKTMLATRLPDLLPTLPRPLALAVTRVHSVAGMPRPEGGLVQRPPFRAPHHGASPVAMIGGGTTWMRPGEISLAHGGVLFLDEMGEFPTTVLDALRQPLEEGVVRVSRARGSTTFPARFILVGAMNPCPCGEGGFPGACRCPESARERYFRRLSAPLLDRFDIAVRIERPDVDELFGEHPPESTSTVSARVAGARRWAVERSGCINSELTGRELDRVAPMSRAAASLLERRVRSGALSARGLDRVRRLARTVADLETLPTEVGVSGMRSGPAGADSSAVGAGDGVTSNGGGADSADVGVIEVEHLQRALVLRCRREYLLGSAQ